MMEIMIALAAFAIFLTVAFCKWPHKAWLSFLRDDGDPHDTRGMD